MNWYPIDRRTRTYLFRSPETPGGEMEVSRIAVTRRSDEGYIAAEIEETSLVERRVFPVRVGPELVVEDGRVILQGPVVTGTAWVDGPDDFRIDSVGDSVTVPAGDFEGCLRITYTNEDTGGGVLWLHKEAGLVKQEQYGERGPFLFELTSIARRS